jgi:Flp pilus assembly pilin Flp
MRAWLAAFREDAAGATAIEYAVIATLIGVTMVSIWLVGGEDLSDGFAAIAARL